MPTKYPIGIQSFEEIRNNNYLYVDKTGLIYKLASEGKYYFLSRPRRFCKSLLLSTMEAYFQGKRELFSGLALERLESEWKPNPILHLDLNSREYKDESSLEAELNRHLEQWEKQYGDGYGDEMKGWALVRINGDRCSTQTAVTRCRYYRQFTTVEALQEAAASYGGLTDDGGHRVRQ